MRLESAAGSRSAEPIRVAIECRDGITVIDPVPLLVHLARRSATEDVGVLAAVFHESIAEMAATVAARIAGDERLDTIALGGGVFQNARMLSSLKQRLTAAGLRVLVPTQLPPNDGAICYGQAAIAAARSTLTVA